MRYPHVRVRRRLSLRSFGRRQLSLICARTTTYNDCVGIRKRPAELKVKFQLSRRDIRRPVSRAVGTKAEQVLGAGSYRGQSCESGPFDRSQVSRASGGADGGSSRIPKDAAHVVELERARWNETKEFCHRASQYGSLARHDTVRAPLHARRR